MNTTQSIFERWRQPLILSVVVLAAITAFAVWTLYGTPELQYQGRPLSLWLADLDSDNLSSQARAAGAVQAIGTNALPSLAKMLRVHDPLWKQALMGLNARQSLLQLPVTPACIVQHRALRGYLELGKTAVAAVPELTRILEEEPSPQARAYAAMALGGIGPEAKAAVPALRQATQAPKKEVRESAIWALANIERKLDGLR